MTLPGAGMGVDSHGGPVIDPTANVIALVKAQQEFNEKLRINDDKWADRLTVLRAKLEQEQKERALERDAMREKLALAEEKRLDALNLAESRRIDALMAAAQTAAALDREKNLVQAQNLAGQVTTSAEVLRASAQQSKDAFDQRLSKIERDMAGGAGKETGGKDTAASIRTAITFGIGLLLALITVVGFLLARK